MIPLGQTIRSRQNALDVLEARVTKTSTAIGEASQALSAARGEMIFSA